MPFYQDWGVVFDVDNTTSFSSTLIVFTNTDGTESRFSGTGFTINPITGQVTGGTITGIVRFDPATNQQLEIVSNTNASVVDFANLVNESQSVGVIANNIGTFLVESDIADFLIGANQFDFVMASGQRLRVLGSNLSLPGETVASHGTITQIQAIDVDGSVLASSALINANFASFFGTFGGQNDVLSSALMLALEGNADLTVTSNFHHVDEQFGYYHYGFGVNGGNHDLVFDLATAFHLNFVFSTVGVTVNVETRTITRGTAIDTVNGTAFFNGVDGSYYNDTLTASHLGSDLFGFFGNDTLIGAAGRDHLEGSFGNDILSGNGGYDNLFGDSGNDTLNGGDGNDRLEGGSGNDTLNGGADNDVLKGGIGNDTVNGGTGDNYFLGGAGADTYIGGTGTTDFDFDQLVFHDQNGGPGAGITVVMNTAGILGAGTIKGGLADGAVNATFVNFERIVGSEGNDNFTAAAGFLATPNNTHNWVGGAGNDVFKNSSSTTVGINYDGEKYLHSAIGNGNTLWGDAAGELGVIINRSAASITANVGGGIKTVAAGRARDTFGNSDSFNGQFGFRLTDAKDYFVAGSAGELRVEGMGGNDIFIGGTGRDWFDGGVGNDTLTAGAGDDFLRGGSGNDTLNGDAGYDYLDGGDGHDTVNGGAGNNYFIGGAGADTYIGGNEAGLIENDTISFYALLGTLGAGISVIMNTTGVVGGGTITDNLVSGLVNSTFSFLESIVGTDGDDSFAASVGFVATANQSLEWTGGKGGDIFVNNSNSNVVIDYEAEQFENTTVGNHNGIWGDAAGELGVIVNRSALSVTVNIGGGAKTVASGQALDTFGTTDFLHGKLGFILTDAKDYYVAGSSGQYYVAGHGGNDTLIGGTGFDWLNGGDGNDIINAMRGNDLMIGGAGADQFRFSTGLNALTNVDSIGDFTHTIDDILLSRTIFASIGVTLDTTELAFGTQAADANDHLIYNNTTGDLFYDADGDGSGGQVLFARVTTGTELTVDDFMLV
jgi:Ca2+-binding RTX toxin-like protein